MILWSSWSIVGITVGRHSRLGHKCGTTSLENVYFITGLSRRGKHSIQFLEILNLHGVIVWNQLTYGMKYSSGEATTPNDFQVFRGQTNVTYSSMTMYECFLYHYSRTNEMQVSPYESNLFCLFFDRFPMPWPIFNSYHGYSLTTACMH